MMSRRRIALTAAGLIAAAAGFGCQTVGPAAWTMRENTSGDFSYSAGRASRSFASPPSTVLPAVLGAMEDLRIQSVRQTNEPGSILLDAVTADNRNASVTLKPHPGGTRMFTRVGLLGDEPLSRALSDRVDIRLGAAPAPAESAEGEASPTPTTAQAEPTTSAPSVGNPYFSRTAVSDEEMLKGMADAHFNDHPSP